jgi:RimJ/RimL family protein N-acetyltransferase
VVIEDSLFEGKTIHFTAVDPQDYKTESTWSYDLDFALRYRYTPARPLAAHELKKYYEKLYKESMEGGRRFHFAIRLKADNCLVGFVRFNVMEWNHRAGSLAIAVGESGMRRGIEPEVLRLALVYAFDELNLHRVAVSLPAYDALGIEFLEDAGFQLEIRRKECHYRAGAYWDWLQYGMLVTEWQNGAQS